MAEPGSTPADPAVPARARTVLAAICAALALVYAFFTCLNPIPAWDFWWQERTGELILRGGVPTSDPFSWTSQGRPWMVHEWLTQVFFHLAYRRLPEGVLVAYKGGLAALACALVMLHAWRRSRSLGAAVLVVLGVAEVMRHYADLRPQMLTFVLLAGLLVALAEYREGRLRRLPWALPPVFLFWSNLHGGVIVGLGLIGLWVLGETVGDAWLGRRSGGLRGLWAALGVSAVAVAANPNGFGVYTYPLHVLGHPEVMDYITEWFSPNFHYPPARPFMLMLLGCLALLALAPTDGRARFGETLVIAATAGAALIAVRNTVPFAIAAAPAMAGAAASLWRAADPDGRLRAWSGRSLDTAEAEELLQPWRRLAGRLGRGGLAFAGMAALLWGLLWEIPRRVPPEPPGRWFESMIAMDRFPVDAVREMDRGAWPGRLYNDYVWGGYLISRAWPRRQVFVDGRAEVHYPSGAFDAEMTIHRVSPGWRQVLDRWRVEVVLTQSSGVLSQALSYQPEWERAFRGRVEDVYVRRRPLPPLPASAGARSP